MSAAAAAVMGFRVVGGARVAVPLLQCWCCRRRTDRATIAPHGAPECPECTAALTREPTPDEQAAYDRFRARAAAVRAGRPS